MENRTALLRLLSGLCDQQLSDAEQSRLEELLADNESRQLYVQYMDMHARLLHHPAAGHHSALPGVDALATVIGGDVEVAGAASNATKLRTTRASWSVSRWLSYAAVAAATLAATVLVQLAILPRAVRQSIVEQSAKGPPAYLATLSQAADVEWGPATPAYKPGARVVGGEFQIQSGVARLSYGEGIELIVEGPARLVLENESTASLLAGKVVFRGDDASAPFTLNTPASVLVDLGTEYAVEVGASREEVHVFSGEVRRLPKAAIGPPRAELLGAGEARQYDDVSAAGKPAAIEPEKFVRTLPAGSAPGANTSERLAAHEAFDYADATALRDETADGGIGFNGPWGGGFARAVGEKNGDRIALNNRQSLSREDVPSASIGGSFEHIGFAKYFRRLAEPVRMDVDGVYYVSFLFRREGPPLDPLSSVSVQLRESDELASDQRGDAIDLRKRLNFGVDRTNELFTHLERVGRRMPLPLSYGETYLLTAKVVAGSVYPDQVFLRVYGPQEPIDREEPSTWSAIGPPIHSDLIFDWLEIHINSSTRQTIDEIRLGTSWSSVAGPWTH